MGLWNLKPVHKIRTRDGAEAEVLSETGDGEWIRVRFLDGADDSLFAGTEDLAHRVEVETLLSIVHKSAWGEKVTVILHHIPESEEIGLRENPATHSYTPQKLPHTPPSRR